MFLVNLLNVRFYGWLTLHKFQYIIKIKLKITCNNSLELTERLAGRLADYVTDCINKLLKKNILDNWEFRVVHTYTLRRVMNYIHVFTCT